MRVRTDRVAFRRPFVLDGLSGIQPPGTYSVETHDERSAFLSLFFGKQSSTWMRISRNHGIGGILKSVELDPIDLAAALTRDALPPEA